MKFFNHYITIFLNFSPISTHLYPLQVENCDSNSRLVVDEDDYGKFMLERVKSLSVTIVVSNPFYMSFKSQLLGMKWVLRHQYM